MLLVLLQVMCLYANVTLDTRETHLYHVEELLRLHPELLKDLTLASHLLVAQMQSALKEMEQPLADVLSNTREILMLLVDLNVQSMQSVHQIKLARARSV
jgi:hypothetical protein